jgi:hypothetical protein
MDLECSSCDDGHYILSNECMSCNSCGFVEDLPFFESSEICQSYASSQHHLHCDDGEAVSATEKQALEIAEKYCNRHCLTLAVFESLKYFVNKYKKLEKQIKSYNLHYAICLIFSLHKHGVFIDQNYIAGSFDICLSKI